MRYKRLTQIVHDKISHVVGPGDWAIDATAGNGHDTLFLAQKVGLNGHLYAFDVQPQALQSTAARLSAAGLIERVTLCQASHAQILEHTPAFWHGAVTAITFNLGYLPGSDRSILTGAASTIPALEQSLCLLKPAGILSILAYRGHQGGLAESAAVAGWLQHRTPLLRYELINSNGPILYVCVKR